jgi:hypothetical protein
MIDGNLQGDTRSPLIPRGHLALVGLALLVLLALSVYMSYDALLRNPGPTSEGAPGVTSSRLASAPDQVSVGGEVTARVTWAGPEAGLVFNVAMDTHSVDLDGYDLSTMAVLQTSDGRETATLNWDSPAGGHHRKGTLAFSETALDGKPLIEVDTESIELVIYDLSGVPTRSFTWALR